MNGFVDKKIGAIMKKKIQIDGTIISLYDLPLISNNNIKSDFENSDYNIACLASPCSYQYRFAINEIQFNIALFVQSCFNLKACFRHFIYAVWMLDGFLLFAYQAAAAGSYTPRDYNVSFALATTIAVLLIIVGIGQFVISVIKK